MSLLLSLINYSSSLQNQFRPTSPKQEDRPRSVYHAKINDQNLQRNKMSSRSLSKIFPQKPQVNIDPKARILHRVTHLLSIKCKKHYYAFFVTLETIKRKNFYLTQDGEFDTIQNQKHQKHDKNLDLSDILHTRQSIKDTTHLQLQVKDSCKQKCVSAMVLKIEQIQSLFLMKQFQKKEKSQFFKWLKFNYLYKEKIQKLTDQVESLKTKYKSRQFIARLKKINQYVYKLQILSSILQSIDKKYHKHFSCEVVKTLTKQVMLKLAKVTSKQLNPINNLTIQKQSIQIRQNSPHKIYQTKSDCVDACNSNTNEINTQQPLESIQQKILNFQKKQFQGEYTSFLKTHSIKTEVDSRPIKIQKHSFCERNSMISKKLPKNYLSINFNDQSSDLNNFLSDRSSLQRNSINLNSDLKQSRVSLYDQRRPFRINPKMIGFEPSAVNPKMRGFEVYAGQQKLQELEISQISEISQLKSQKSTNTLLSESKMNVSCFGGQAVNFKNSLVQERQSLKNSEKNFIKKPRKTEDFLQYPKELLRSSFDNERRFNTFVAERNHQNWVNVQCANNVGIHKNINSEYVFGNNHSEGRLLSRVPSGERKHVHEIHPFNVQPNFLHRINQELLDNKTVFPTRDNSSSYYTQRVAQKRQQKKTSTQNSNKIRGCIKLSFNTSNKK